jgi:hypothetical protein
MTRSRWFYIYVKVSEHLSIPVSEVIRRKFEPDFRVLIMYYHNQLIEEEKAYEKQQKEIKKMKR